MSGPINVLSRKPSDCHDTEIGDFMALVLAGGEVVSKDLESRIRSAASLVFLTVGCCLCGVAALKRPELSYRKRISLSADVPLSQNEFPYELGWVFILPSARGRKFSIDLTRAALSAAGTQGVFATSRTDNHGMHATLSRFQFVLAGKPYSSGRGNHQLQLFLRRAAQPTLEADASLKATLGSKNVAGV